MRYLISILALVTSAFSLNKITPPVSPVLPIIRGPTAPFTPFYISNADFNSKKNKKV